jgi:peptidoglycan-associated lipoprotein
MTQRAFFNVMACAAAAALLTGCPPAYPKCDTDAQCKEHGEVCVQGQCKECATDNNCKAGFICDANTCVPKPECRDDKGCTGGKKCQGGKCVEPTSSKEPGTCTTNDDCGTGEECKGGRCVSKGGGECDWSAIHFGFNESKIEDSDRNRLNALADCIRAGGVHVTLEGHADERGTEEYNLQLSNRRAASVKRYFMDLGIKDSFLDTVGYGENKPAVQGSNESAWAANRRVEFKKK